MHIQFTSYCQDAAVHGDLPERFKSPGGAPCDPCAAHGPGGIRRSGAAPAPDEVSENGGTPKWTVYSGKSYIWMIYIEVLSF
jgi:hypothetical protein